MEIGSKRYTIANDFSSPRCKFAEPTVSHTASVDAQPRVGSLRSTAKLTMQNGSSQPLHSVTAASQAVTPAIFGPCLSVFRRFVNRFVAGARGRQGVPLHQRVSRVPKPTA